MNALVISHTYIARINRDKWKVFASRYSDVHVTVVFPKTWPTHLFFHRIKNLAGENSKNCTFVALDAYNTGNEVKYSYNSRALIKLLIETKPGIIHVEQGVHAFSYFQVILFSYLLGLCPRFVFFTWVNWHAKFSLKYRFFIWLLEKINISCSSGAIAGNNDAKEILHKQGLKKDIMVAPQLGVNQKIFTPALKTRMSDEKKYIGYIGRITEEKGVFLLIQAYALIHAQFPDWGIRIVGDGPSKKQLIDFVVKSRLIDKVEFADSVTHDAVAYVLHGIDILVLPSYDTSGWKEQFGHVLIEAMACKVPVIGSSAGEIAQVIGDSGLVFVQTNIESLTGNLRSLMSDEFLRHELGQKGYERVRNNYTHEVIAEKTYTFWRTLIEG